MFVESIFNSKSSDSYGAMWKLEKVVDCKNYFCYVEQCKDNMILITAFCDVTS